MKVLGVLIAEIEIPTADEDDFVESFQSKLDAFREAVRPAQEYGVTLYRASREDLEKFAAAGALLPQPQLLTK